MINLRETCNAELARTPVLDLNWEDPALYADWLAQTLQYVLYSTRIIGLAGCLFGQDQDDLHHRFLQHVAEEKHHEKLLLNDLKALGYSPSDFERGPSADVLFQNQYYWIQNVAPISVYGYFLYLESASVHFGPAIYKRVLKAHPEKATRFLKVHVGEDVGHVDIHYSFTDKLTAAEQKMIQENLVQSGFLYRAMIDQVKANGIQRKTKKVS